MSDKFKGHTRGTILRQSRNDSSGYFLQWHGMIVAQCMTKPNAELFAAAPELLAENERLKAENERLRDQLRAGQPELKIDNERLRRELGFFVAENARIKDSNRRLEVEAIQRQGEFDRTQRKNGD